MTVYLVERVARAIENKMFAPHELPLSEDLHERYLETARAAIAAMREPTEEMLSAGDSAIPLAEANICGERMQGREVALEAWTAMVGEALK